LTVPYSAGTCKESMSIEWYVTQVASYES
jgi:hypothetical protein